MIKQLVMYVTFIIPCIESFVRELPNYVGGYGVPYLPQAFPINLLLIRHLLY